MKKFWWKLSVEWPCALGDWLRANFVVFPAALLDRLTFRSTARIVVQIIVFVALLTYFEQVVALHLTFLFAVDANAYFDILAAVSVFAARGQLAHMLQATKQVACRSIQNCLKMLLRFRTRQRRIAEAPGHCNDGDQKQPDDEPGCWCVLYAVA